MKVNYRRLFVDLLLMGIIPLIMLLMGIGTWKDINELQEVRMENQHQADVGLEIEDIDGGQYAMVNYVLDVEYEMQVNMELTTLAISYVFLGMIEGIIFMFVFKNFKNGRYFEVL